MKNIKRQEILILGAGASGMMAALSAAGQGAQVLLLEKMKSCGRKLLATGNGKCNFTNAYQAPECYRGENPEFIRQALGEFTHQDVLCTFHDMGILSHAREGYYYPASGQASSVVEAFGRRLNDYRVSIRCTEQVLSLKQEKSLGESGFVVGTDKGTYFAPRVILAMGGCASPVHGTTGDGYKLVRSLGLSLVEPLPALTSCVLKGEFTKEWAGVRVKGKVSLYTGEGECLGENQGELQMVAYGLSGIPVFQISRYASRALAQGKKTYILMDIMPEFTKEQLCRELEYRSLNFPKWTGVDGLEGMMHRKLAKVLLKSLGMDPGLGMGKWNREQRERIASRMKEWKLGVQSVSGFDKAQVTCGGVRTDQIHSHTMEVKDYPGLYLTGEMLDVDGICGGYNLQWAWTSGYLAGKNAAQSLRERNGQVKHD